MSFTLINGDCPEDQEVATWAGEASDYGDKGINKAETAGTKYFLMRLFNISEKGDEDADAQTPAEMKETRPASKFSRQTLAEAKLRLGMAADIAELKSVYTSLGEVAKDPEIIKFKDEMKGKL